MITELVQMRIREDIGGDAFISIVDTMEKEFHMKLDGCVDSELFKGDDDLWRMIMHWKSKEALKEASGLMMQSESTLDFRNCLIPSSVRILIFDQVGAWQR